MHVASLTGLGTDPRSQSGPATKGPPRPTTDRHAPDRRPTRYSPDRYPLILTIAVPHAAEWTAAISWGRILTPTGILAVITHSEHGAGRWKDLSRSLLHTTRREGLALLDRISIVADAAGTTARQAVRQAHTEILLVTHPRPEAAATTAKEARR
jgi:hypothetical protein